MSFVKIGPRKIVLLLRPEWNYIGRRTREIVRHCESKERLGTVFITVLRVIQMFITVLRVIEIFITVLRVIQIL
jgi:hypothetical protein